MFRVVSLRGQQWEFESHDDAWAFKDANDILGFVQRILPEDECDRCKWDTNVPHNSCLYGGRRIGHSIAHCTADACF